MVHKIEFLDLSKDICKIEISDEDDTINIYITSQEDEGDFQYIEISKVDAKILAAFLNSIS